jgi:hypothetical protein
VVRTEVPFSYGLESGAGRIVVGGVVDVHAEEDRGALIVDYKTDRLGGRDPEAVTRDSYATQRLVYALAALRQGTKRVEVAHCFLERPDRPAVASFNPADREPLERGLAALASRVVAGPFVPAAEPHRGLCLGCPGQPALCSWGPERTLASR